MSNPEGASRTSSTSKKTKAPSSRSGSGRGLAKPAKRAGRSARKQTQDADEQDEDVFVTHQSIVCQTASGSKFFYRSAPDAGGQCWG
ncbi:hypothetical protein PYCC9005_005082 [Savitreella phatthalungensis]